MFVFYDDDFLECCRFLRTQGLCLFQERYVAMAQELIEKLVKREIQRNKGDKTMDTGYPALIPDIPAGKTDRNVEMPQPQAWDDPSATRSEEERAEKGTAK